MSGKIKDLIRNFKNSTDTAGTLLSFEGLEGCGKTTQIELLQKELQSRDYQVSVFREPGSTRLGEEIRELLLQSKSERNALSETFLFLSARTQLLTEKVLPALEEPKHVVILDRYLDSTIAYQGIARGIGLERVVALHQVSPLNILPEKTFLLDIPLETSFKRIEERNQKENAGKDQIEQRSLEYFEKVHIGLKRALKYFPERITAVDANREREVIHQEILDSTLKLLQS